ncbi:threonine synthase [Halopenitus persicus]|uniref:Threonine synthase n=1 Tax=Halopenitus persicus TaxID=1048396 RepID=A0A1H3IBM5_9EURY|nr:pyridoxal-phosphate dependent enzyme [Halopenitus persicus]SDY25101.1 threonine synthase [Halopenitus persicus]
MSTLTCYACGETVEAPAPPRCPCGEPRWYETDPAVAEFEWPVDLAAGTWAFADLLPVAPPADGLATASGGTPLVRTPALDEYAGAAVSVADEGRNPTGSFKDRGTAVGIEIALAEGADAVGTVSHGNMAMSVAAHAAAAGVECTVCVPDDISAERIRNIGRYDPRILRIDGDYGRLYYDAIEAGAERGIRFINSDSPGRVAGQKTTVLEALDQHRRRTGELPDAIVLPSSSGGHASGAYKGLSDLRAAGLIDPDAEPGAADAMPRLYLVQAAACAPIAEAAARGAETVERVEPGETIAYSIANPDPPSGTRALYGARETGGTAIFVPDDAIREAKRRLATAAGLTVEASSATSLAGARRLAREGEIDADESVVCIATGSGFKESVGDPDDVRTETVTLEAFPDAL